MNEVRTGAVGTSDEIVFSYHHDDIGRLWKVTYPNEATPSDPSDDPFREYKYDSEIDGPNPNLFRTHLLTEIIDENLDRTAFVEYDLNQRVSMSEGGNGANRTRFEYLFHETPQKVKVTTVQSIDPNTNADLVTNERTFILTEVEGLAQIKDTDGNCPTCSESEKAKTYDQYGFLNFVTDHEDNVTDYDYNDRGLIEKKTEGYGTLEARITDTVWNANLRLPDNTTLSNTTSQVQRTTFTYWNKLVKTRAIEDLTPFSDTTRTTTNSYWGELGGAPTGLESLLKLVDGPRSLPIDDRTEYFYYDFDNPGSHRKGDLEKIRQYVVHPGGTFLETKFLKYDDHGRPLEIEDPNGLITKYTYHPRGWVTSIEVDGNLTTMTYDDIGQLDKVWMPEDNIAGLPRLDYDYDDAHRLTDIKDSLGATIHYELDAMGNRIEETTSSPVAIGITKGRTINAENLVEALWYSNSTASHGRQDYTYDDNGNLETTTIPETQFTTDSVTANHYDALNRLAKMVDALNGESLYEYDVLDNLKTVADPKRSSIGQPYFTEYKYNGFGELRELDSPDSGVTTYEYDAAGNRTKQTDARFITTNYVYDALNRLKLIDYPNDTDTQFFYDAEPGAPDNDGRLTRMIDEVGTTTFVYDKRGNLLSKSFAPNAQYAPHVVDTFAVSYTPNDDNKTETITYPSGMIVTYVYGADGKVSGINTNVSGFPTVLSNVVRFPFDRVNKFTYGTGLLHQIFRTNANFTHYLMSGSSLFSSPYYQTANVLNNGNTYSQGFWNVTEGSWFPTRLHEIDRLNRITEVDNLGTVEYTFEYDENGSRTKKVGGGATQNTPSEVYSNRRSTASSYDFAGNLTQEFLYAPNPLYLYWESGRTQFISGYISGPLDQLVPMYNGFGERTITRHVQDGLWSATYDVSNVDIFSESGLILSRNTYTDFVVDPTPHVETTREYIYLDDVPVAVVETEYHASGNIAGRTPYYARTDKLGRIIELFDTGGTLRWRRDVDPDPFMPGEGDTDPDLDGNDVYEFTGFPGQLKNEPFGTYYNYFRDYDPRTARYIQSDPIGLAGGLNTYSYALNNPVRYIDPTGLIGEFLPNTVANPIRDASDYIAEAGGGAVDFGSNFNSMVGADFIGSDLYFHCKANCEATRRGEGGEDIACLISDGREAFDQIDFPPLLKGDTKFDSSFDQLANKHGRSGANEFPHDSCKIICAPLRPRGLPNKY